MALAAMAPMPPSVPASEASSMGMMNVFWLGDCAKAVSARTYFSAIE